MKLIYTANTRIPSEKAHPYQIVQMCEAFAQNGAEVTLLYANRVNTPDLRTDDIWAFYAVERNFQAERLWVLDLYSVARRLPHRLAGLWEHLAALMVAFTFNASLLKRLSHEHEAAIYSRDPLTLALLALLWPRRARRLFFEAHTYPATRAGLLIRRWLAKRIGGFIVITDHLRQRYEAVGVPSQRLTVAHDGFRRSRFEIEGDRTAWREKIGWPQETFIVGYMGRFQTLGMDKGLVDLADAVIALAHDRADWPVRLGLVGGPDYHVESLRERFSAAGISPGTVLYAGHVPAAGVPGYLCAFDICTMPFPWTEHFAYYASPMKLFEYMASGSPLVATNLPSTAEIICDGRNGLLVPPSNVEALTAALRRLRDEPGLALRLAEQARSDVFHFTWDSRAQSLLQFIASLS